MRYFLATVESFEKKTFVRNLLSYYIISINCIIVQSNNIMYIIYYAFSTIILDDNVIIIIIAAGCWFFFFFSLASRCSPPPSDSGQKNNRVNGLICRFLVFLNVCVPAWFIALGSDAKKTFAQNHRPVPSYNNIILYYASRPTKRWSVRACYTISANQIISYNIYMFNFYKCFFFFFYVCERIFIILFSVSNAIYRGGEGSFSSKEWIDGCTHYTRVHIAQTQITSHPLYNNIILYTWVR